MVSSTDGYCSIITFGPGELGVPYESKESGATSLSSSEAPTNNSLLEKRVSDDVNIAISTQSELVANIDLTKDEDDFEGIRKLDEECSEEKVCNEAKYSSSTPESKSKKDTLEKSDINNHTTEQKQNFDSCKSPESNSNTYSSETVTNTQRTPSTKGPVTEDIVTPGNSGKKARRVQLITLSSPKSKKKLL